MTKRIVLLLTLFCILPFGLAQGAAPLKLIKKMVMPSYIQGPFDHLAVDAKTHRVFVCAEINGKVVVFNYQTGKLVHIIGDLKKPHAILIRDSVNRLFVTDGVRGGVQVFNLTTYQPTKFIPLRGDTDSIYYDPSTKDMYVVNGGGDIHETYSFVSVINTDSEKKVADIKIDGDTLEALRFEPGDPTMYQNDPAKNTVVVVNRDTHTVEKSWPLTKGSHAAAMSLDAAHHRLFIGCRSGVIDVFDTQTGKELQALPIAGFVDDMHFDPATQRIYAICGGGQGEIDVYKETDPDHYQLLGKVPSRYFGKTGV
ncbi:MAG TPA: YncE family protein, partial [Terriglobia bacterium]|nr:YncE family protein [Terriglobia bacterium]